VITNEIQGDNWHENQDDSHPIPKKNWTLVLIPISWAFMIRYQIANLSFDFFLSIIWTSNLKMKNVNPFFMFTLQVPMVQKVSFWTPFVICTFVLKFWNTLGLQFSKWENENVEIHFSTPLGMCLSPKTLFQFVSPMFFCLGHECNIRVTIHPSCHN
jgi:hypothetical protein